MANAPFMQCSFNHGEIDPALAIRSDWKYYASSCKTLKNMLVRQQGGAFKRPGTKFVDYALSQDAPSFFIPFVFSAINTCMLEFGDFQMRIIIDGELVQYPADHPQAGQVVVVQTPYAAEDVPLLRYAQTGDIMHIAITNHRPRTLKRYSYSDWRFDDLDFGQQINPPNGLRLTKNGANAAQYCVTALASDTVQSTASDTVECTQGNGQVIAMPNASVYTLEECRVFLLSHGQDVPADWDIWNMSADRLISWLNSLGYSLRYHDAISGMTIYQYRPDGVSCGVGRGQAYTYSNAWNEAMYTVSPASWGVGVLNKARQDVIDFVNEANEGNAITGHSALAWDAVDGAASYFVFRSVRTDDGVKFYYIGSTTETTFDDDNLPIDSSRGLPVSDNPFDAPDNYPGVVAFFEQRIIYARSNNNPTKFWGSVTGNYNSFNTHTPIQDDDAFSFSLASGEMDAINWIIPLDELLLGTSGSEWRVGGGSAALSPLNVNARPQSFYGGAALNPVKVGRTVIFVSRGNKTIRTFSYSLNDGGYSGRDITTSAGHLFDGKTIVSIAYQAGRDGILWAVMSDGTLLSCTFEPDEDVNAWMRHETNGKVETIGTVKDEDGIDQLYLCVARTINGQTKRFIEMLGEPIGQHTEIEDMAFSDCSLSGFFPGGTNYIAGLDHLEGEKIVALCDGNVIRDLTVVNGRVDFPGGRRYDKVHAGLPYESELETLNIEPMTGGTGFGRPRIINEFTAYFMWSRECFVGDTQTQTETEVKFRTEAFDQPIQPFTGEKAISIHNSAFVRSTALRFVSRDPVPFGLLAVFGDIKYGGAS